MRKLALQMKTNIFFLRALLKIFFWVWGTTCAIVVLITFMQAYLNGNNIIVSINDYHEARLEFHVITLFGGTALVGGFLLLLEFLEVLKNDSRKGDK